MELIIPLIGAIVAIIVSIIGAYLANRNSIVLQTRKLKESHYINYITALHYYTASNGTDKVAAAKYTETRNVIFAIASTEVSVNIIEFEKHSFGSSDPEKFNSYLTELIKSIRKDLKLKNKNMPTIGFLQV